MTSRMADQLVSIAKHAIRTEGLFGFYEYEIISQNGWNPATLPPNAAPLVPGYEPFDIIDAKPVGDPTLPSIARCPSYPSMGGVQAYWGPGAKILVGFVGGLASRPFAAFGDPSKVPLFVAVGGSGAITSMSTAPATPFSTRVRLLP